MKRAANRMLSTLGILQESFPLVLQPLQCGNA